jgi:putative component of toxin-antitoxin plasmid stabilization module
MTQKLTPWFPGDVKPVRAGVYERQYGRGLIFFCLYDKSGKWRYGTVFGPEAAMNMRNIASPMQTLPWRGIQK